MNGLKRRSTALLRRRRLSLLQRLPPLDAILRGSLIERYKPCGRAGCKCAEGPGHGPKYYLSVSQAGGGRPKMDYVPLAFCEQVEQYLANYQEVRKILEEICEINRELLRRREPI